MTLDDVLRSASLTVTALGVLSAGAVLARAREVRLPIAVLLDFLLAAGLLRLAVAPAPRALASAALIIIIRKIITFGFAHRTAAPAAVRPVPGFVGTTPGNARPHVPVTEERR